MLIGIRVMIIIEQTEENLQCGNGGLGKASGKSKAGAAQATKRANAAGAIIDQLQTPRSVGNRAGDAAFARIKELTAARKAEATATNTANARRNALPKVFETGVRQMATGKSKSQVKREMKAEAKRRKTN